ncbi:hypothetical protein B0H11DRAFT_2247967 [Mycena galericulata]|nr:hypothetical protein B0H11DRAFT_2247967 [Mycena galericulata]
MRHLWLDLGWDATFHATVARANVICTNWGHGTWLATTLSRYPRLTAPADALLRFVTTLPPVHPDLLTGTLAFYTALAAHGLYAHITSPPCTVRSPPSPRTADADRGMQHVWAGLPSVWVVCGGPAPDDPWAQYSVEPPFGPRLC